LKNFRNILVIGERKIFAELSEITKMAFKSNAIMKDMFKIGNNNPIALLEKMHEIRNIEKESDKIAFKFSEHITSGAVSPNIIDNLIECGHVADNIVDLYYYLSREQYRMSKTDTFHPTSIEDSEWISLYIEMLDLAEKSLSSLEHLLSTESMNEILEAHKDIELFEEQGDDVKDAGFDKLYSLASKLHYLQFYHYTELLHKCDDILDSCEDLSDLVVSVVTSILK
jgi:uncharacterized protein Yka (UPF0111/DUF47 family)